jgi:hypothetical protein
LGLEVIIKKDILIDEDNGMVVIANIDDIVIATKGSKYKNRRQVGTVFDLLLKNNMCVSIDKCAFDQTEVLFLGFIVNRKEIEMDPEKAKDIVNWAHPTNRKEVQQLLRLWNF